MRYAKANRMIKVVRATKLWNSQLDLAEGMISLSAIDGFTS